MAAATNHQSEGSLSLVVAFFLLSLHQGSAARDTHAPFSHAARSHFLT
jgi:hypothetical protein